MAPIPVESLIASQEANMEAFNRFATNFKKCAKANLTPGYLKGRLEGLNRLWTTLEQTNHQIACAADDQQQKALSYFTEDSFTNYEEKYYDLYGRINDMLAHVPNAPAVTQSDTHLPPVSIPTFSGLYSQWQAFHDMFLALVGNHPSLTAVQKLHYLRKAVSGEAEQLLRSYPIAETNYEPAWRALCKRYNNKRLLINAQLSVLFNTAPIQKESAESIRNLFDATNECLTALTSFEINVDSWDLAIIHVQSHRLPSETRQAWEQKLSVTTEPPTLNSYLDFLESRFRTLEAINPYNSNKTTKRNVQAHYTTATQPSSACSYCNNVQHHIRKCADFHALSHHGKMDHVKTKNLCFNCLASEHNSKSCPSKRGCFHCGRKHHSLLHDTYTQAHNSRNANPTNISTLHIGNQCNAVLLSTALINVQRNGINHTLRALIDTGSQGSFITTAAMQRLQLKPLPAVIRITGIGCTQTEKAHQMVEFSVRSRVASDFQLKVEAIVLPTLTDLLPQTKLPELTHEHLADLNLADPFYYKPASIEVILGSDVYPMILREGIRTGAPKTPIAQNTALGWILLGPLISNVQTTCAIAKDMELDSQLRKFWELEEVCSSSYTSKDDAQCEEIYSNTHFREPNGRYVVSLPFKESPKLLGVSEVKAINQFKALERRFSRDPQFFASYKACIEEYKNLQLLERIPCNEIRCHPHYYLPHHAVLKPSSVSTKLRIVFNASSKSDTGLSLNNILHVGPSLHKDLPAVITRWRMYKKAFSADMEKMYLQIRLAENHRDFQRILWRPAPSASIEHYRLNAVTFGVSSAPYLAMRTIQQLVKDEGYDLPQAVQALNNELYVDNVLSGGDDVEEAVIVQEELMKLLQRGGFNLRQWASNDPEVIRQIPVKDKLIASVHTIGDSSEEANTLGLIWHYCKDDLTLKFKLTETDCQANTKRSLLSCIARLFDPLGWYSPVIIQAKIFLQTLWLLNVGWDDPLPQDKLHEWQKFQSALPELERITIPRWIHTTKMCTIQLHGFSDASERAYAAVIYARVVDKHRNTIQTSLLTAKTKVAPIKTVSLPRLELCGAALLAKLVDNIIATLNWTDIPIYCWSDSTITLAWLEHHPCQWKTFVANRTSTIHELVPTASWQHVPSKENPADPATKGLCPSLLLDCSLWWHGPDWLCKPPSSWPTQGNCTTALESRKKIVATIQVQRPQHKGLLDVTKFSSYNKLRRVTAYILRFVFNSKANPQNRITGPLTEAELNQAVDYWIRTTQLEFYATEIALLKNKCISNSTKPHQINSKKSKKKPFKALTPFLDGNGTLRVGGRLQHADLPYDEKHPVLLPPASHLAKLIVHAAHANTLHGGTTATMAYIRRKFWIPRLRSIVKHHIQQCVRCFRQQKLTSEQLMGDLPKPRITPARPFVSTGIDYAGPLSLRASTIRNSKVLKGYFAIFVCLCTKAIHLEAVSDLSTEAFLAALRRFIARRGICKDIYSDCGTNFVGADTSLRKAFTQAITTANGHAAELLANDGVRWHFIPPASPHFGGLWEAGVRSVKHHLRRILGNTICTFEEMTTLLAQIEACLNSRPLCPQSDDPNDLGSLTPGHFLIGTALTAPPHNDYSHTKHSSLKRWALLQKMHQDFWNRWRNEYLSRLQQRPKWHHVSKSPQIGQLVLVKDERLPPLKWLLGRITNTFVGPDGLVRVVELKTQSSLIRRSIHKICPLPTDDIWHDNTQSTDALSHTLSAHQKPDSE